MPDVYISSQVKNVTNPPQKTTKAKKGEKAPTNYKWDLKKSNSPLASFLYSPRKVNFETKDREEKIILLLRRHPITNVPWIIVSTLMFLAPVVVAFLPISSLLPEKFQVVGILGWYLVTTAFILENFLGWFFNVNIITDERIIDIDFHNLIYKEITDAKIDKIQDVTLKMGGVVRLVFNYGDILVQTAAEVPTLDFLAVPKPDKVVRIIQDLIIEEEKEKLEGRIR